MNKIKIFFSSATASHFELVFWDAERVHRRLLPRRQILHSSHSFCCLYPAEIDLTFFLYLKHKHVKIRDDFMRFLFSKLYLASRTLAESLIN